MMGGKKMNSDHGGLSTKAETPGGVAGLRQRAEVNLREQPDRSPEELQTPSPVSMDRALHELRVHQIELEMQNDELRHSQDALESLRARYFDLYDLAPVGYCTLSEPGVILQANLMASRLLGVTRSALVRQTLSHFVAREDANRYHRLRRRLIETSEAQMGELRMLSNDGTSIWVHIAAAIAQEEDGSTVLRVVLSDITKQKQVEVALQKSEAFSLAILDSLNAEIAVLDRDGKIVAINQSWRRFTSKDRIHPGQRASPITVGSDYLALCHEASTLAVEGALNAHEGIRTVIDGRSPGFTLEYPYHSPEKQRWCTMSVTPFGDGAVIAHTDVTELKQAEAALNEQLGFFHLIAENIGDFIAVLDPQGRRLYNSPSYMRFFGDTSDLIGSDSFAEIHPDDQQRMKLMFSETVRSGLGRQTNYRFVKADGSIREMESVGSVIRDGQGEVARVVVVSRDITERKQIEDQVRQLAFHDTLTKLPNRRLLNDRLSQAVAASTRRDCFGALMFLDLDNFKQLNDSHGHGAGDLLLVQAADRLKSCVREMDTVARFGGDEFVVMINELDADRVESLAQASLIAEKIRATLSATYQLTIRHDGQVDTRIGHQCTASIGVVLFMHQQASQDILKRADVAMYQAKASGRNAIQFADLPG